MSIVFALNDVALFTTALPAKGVDTLLQQVALRTSMHLLEAQSFVHGFMKQFYLKAYVLFSCLTSPM